MELTNFVTIPNIKLFSVGRWPTWPEETDITESDLRYAVEAQSLPGYQSPRIKLGHVDDRFNDPGFGRDGQPTLGVVKDLRLSEDAQDLYGDLVGIPGWLATIAPYAFPQRSVEVKKNLKSDLTGRNQPVVVEALALLGEHLPAVSTLDDLQMLFSKEGPALLDPTADIVSDKEGSDPIPTLNVAASASMGTNIEDVRRAFYDRPETSESLWIRSVNINPQELIVSDESDNSLYSVKFSFNADGKPQFGGRKRVKVSYEDHADADDPAVLAAAAVRASEGEPLVVYSTRAVSRPTKEEPMADLSAIAKHLGLSTDATEEDILSKLPNIPALEAARVAAEAAEQAEIAAAEQAEADAKAEAEAQADLDAIKAGELETVVETPAVVEAPAPTSFTVPEGMALVDADMLAALTQAASESTALAAEQYIDSAVAAGKFPPSKKAFYASLYGDNPMSARVLIDSMAAILPVGAPKGIVAGTATETPDGVPAVFPDELLAHANPKAHAERISLRSQANPA